MAIPQDEVERKRAAARFHLQIELGERPGKHVSTGPALVRGRVLRIFRGDSSIRPGDPLSFDLNVCSPGETPPPGSAHVSYDALLHARHMEVFLNGTPPRCDLVEDGWAVLSETSEGPVLSEQADEAEAPQPSRRNWWQFWR